MKNKYKTVLWGLYPLDYRAMEVYLEDMAQRGWMLEKVGLLRAKFRAIEPKSIKFCVDVFKHGGPFTPENTRENKVYKRKATELGWHFITAQRYLQFFYAEEGENPERIEIDEEAAFHTIKKTVFKDELLSLVTSIIFQFIIIRSSFPIKYTALLSYVNLLIICGLPLLVISTVYRSSYAFIWFYENSSNIKKGMPMRIPSLKGARKRGKIFNGLTLTYGIFLLVSIVLDLIIGPNLSIMTVLPVLMGSCIGVFLRYIIKKRAEDQRDAAFYAILGIIAAVLIVNIIGAVYISRTAKPIGYKDSIPKDYPILTMAHISENIEEDRVESRRFKPGSSPVIPKYYELWENWRGSGKQKSLNIYYYEGIHPYFSEIIFNGKTEGINTVLGWRNQFLREDEKLKDLYGADQLQISQDRDWILIRKGNKTVHLFGDINFTETRVVNGVIHRLLKE